jgi:hypothetical protein
VAQDFKQDDRVKWNTSRGETYGKVKTKLTSSTEVGVQKINARKKGGKEMADDRQQTIDEFGDAVNMTRKELENWLGTEESQSVGQGNGESKGHQSGRKIVEILEKNKSDYTDDDIDHMRRVVSYVHRHQSQKPEGDMKNSNWHRSLLNWGHDPLK